MNRVGVIVRETAELFVEAAPWLLAGFFAAGLLKAWIPARAIVGRFGRDDLRSVFLASLYGIPLPLCSCSVLPTATALRRSGASRGATASFLISTPETGVDSIGITWALFDPWMTALRPLVAFVTALVTGGLVNLMGKASTAPTQSSAATLPRSSDAGCGAAKCCADDEHSHPELDWDASELAGSPLGVRLRKALRFAFGPLLDDLSPWLVLGFAVSGLISAFAPADLFGGVVPRGLPAMLLLAAIGAPLYVCATASTPVAAVLVAKGLDPGAALVFLLVGPATNASTMLVVRRLLGGRVLVVYLATILATALVAGFAANALYEALGIDLATVVETGISAHEHGPIALVAAGVLLVLLTVSLVRLARARRAARSGTGA